MASKLMTILSALPPAASGCVLKEGTPSRVPFFVCVKKFHIPVLLSLHIIWVLSGYGALRGNGSLVFSSLAARALSPGAVAALLFRFGFMVLSRTVGSLQNSWCSPATNFVLRSRCGRINYES